MLIDTLNGAGRFFYKRSFGLLLIRLVVGLIFLVHGWDKVENISQVAVFFGTLGFWPWVAYFIGWLEVIGGLALILGIATRAFGVLFGIEMIVAAALVGAAHGFSGIEFELLLAAASFGLALIGSGKYSVYKMECQNCGGVFCNAETGVCVAVP
ncbi:MAG: DoxX family protein [bacterium]